MSLLCIKKLLQELVDQQRTDVEYVCAEDVQGDGSVVKFEYKRVRDENTGNDVYEPINIDGSPYTITGTPRACTEAADCTVTQGYMCIDGVQTPVLSSVDNKTLEVQKVVNALDGTEIPAPWTFVGECQECNVLACVILRAFDQFDESTLVAGQFQEMQLVENGTTITTIPHDYLTTADGTNKSPWYTPWVSAINALPNWSIVLDTEVPSASSGKVSWLIQYDGPGNETLRIYKGNVGGAPTSNDFMEISVDAAGVVSTQTGSGAVVAPWSTYPFTATIC